VDVERIGYERAAADKPVDAGAAGQQGEQGLLALHQHRAAVLLDQRRVADELNGVAQALLGMEQDRAAGERGAVPERLAE
jgi:hypothetical protein